MECLMEIKLKFRLTIILLILKAKITNLQTIINTLKQD